MLETKEQKQTFAAAALLILILAIISFKSRPNFRYQEPAPSGDNQSVADAQKYLAYLATLKVDPKASRDLFEQILTEEDIRREVESELEVNRPKAEPAIDRSKLTVLGAEGEQAAVDYLAKLTGSALNFNANSKPLAAALFSRDAESLNRLKAHQQKALNEFFSLPAPTEAAGLQASVAKSFTAYGELIDAALAYAQGNMERPWPGLYAEYLVINDEYKITSQEIDRLSQKYKIGGLAIRPVYAFDEPGQKAYFIKEARALFGIGDVSITAGDIPRIIMDAVKEGLTNSFSQFMGNMLNKLISKIESNYLIANFLFYTDALVSGQYTEDYLQKYVKDQVDRQIIKRFIPQFNCGTNPLDLKPIFQAKAKDYLGFEVKNLRPSDPDYYAKLARVGDFMSSPSGWEQYYKDQAELAKSEAEKAAESELISPGLKTPRDTVKSVIAISVNNIVSASRSSLGGLMNLGASNAESFISGFIAQLTEALVNKFVFRGASAQGGALAVLKEQKTCLAAAQLTPVLPIEPTQYQSPPLPPTQEELLQQECAKYPRGCTVLPDTNLSP